MGKLVMGFVVMSQVLLILEHLVAVFALKCVIVLMTLFVSLSVRNRVKDDSTEGATVSHPFMRGQMCQFVLVQFPIKSEWPAADVAVKLVRIFTMLGSFVLHSASIRRKYCSTLPPACMWLDPSVAVEVSLHVAVHKESLTTHVAGIPHVTCVLSEMLFQVLLFPIFPLTSRELALIPHI